MDRTEPTRRGGQRTGRLSGLLVGALVTALSFGCRVPEAYVWNLKQVHDADGTPKRYGILRTPIQQLFADALDSSDFGAPSFAEDKAEAIDDPLGVCLTNLHNLFDGGRGNPQTLAKRVEMLTWLGGDCTYLLSRERCALALGNLGRRYGAVGPKVLAAEVPVATVEEIREIYRLLGADVLPVLTGSVQIPPLLQEHCEAAAALALNRAAGRRLVSATASLLEGDGFERPELEPLAALHRETARHCLELVLGKLVTDPEARVRAAAIKSWIELSGGRDEAGYLAAFRDQDPMPVLEAVRALARYGIPGPAEREETAEGDERDHARDWHKRLIALLSAVPDGMLTLGTCRTLAQLTGRPENLRPEHWITWWLDSEAEREFEPARP